MFIAAFAQGQDSNERTKLLAKIAEIEQKIANLPANTFDFPLHNELRHLYSSFNPAKSMAQVDLILQHQPFDGYMKQVLGGTNPDRRQASAALLAMATKYPNLKHLQASCLIWAGELDTDGVKARAQYEKVLTLKDLPQAYREAAEDRLRFDPTARKPWPAKITAPKGLEAAPGPWSDPDEQTVWPNTTSRANGDQWLVANHDRIKVMRPRVLLINFSNEHTRPQLDKLATQLIRALKESSRYHGYRDEKAPAFLEYQILKFVDLRDPGSAQGNSSKIPVKNPNARTGFNMKYRQFFSPEFAEYYDIPDPRDPKRFLRLDELLDGGYVHEVWFFESGNVKAKPHVGAYEVIEQKPKYDAQFKKSPRDWVEAGNGGDTDLPWVGRSCRIGDINASRGIGCFLESLAHGMEGMANSGAIPYFTKYFKEYADFNLKGRYQLPFESLYEVNYGGQQLQYPDEKTLVIKHGGKEYRIENYIPAGGSAHFPPNARGHYDLDNGKAVLSTIEDWRIGSGKDGKDLTKPFTNQSFRGNRDLAPDCMGAWLVYWRQNMPSLNNKQKDDDRKPMKNWLPFLFY